MKTWNGDGGKIRTHFYLIWWWVCVCLCRCIYTIGEVKMKLWPKRLQFNFAAHLIAMKKCKHKKNEPANRPSIQTSRQTKIQKSTNRMYALHMHTHLSMGLLTNRPNEISINYHSYIARITCTSPGAISSLLRLLLVCVRVLHGRCTFFFMYFFLAFFWTYTDSLVSETPCTYYTKTYSYSMNSQMNEEYM